MLAHITHKRAKFPELTKTAAVIEDGKLSAVNSKNKIKNLTHVKTPKSHFNQRVMAHQYKKYIYFQIHDVYYTKGVADSYTENGVRVGGDSIEEIRSVLERMIACLDKPILWYGDKFPAEYKSKKQST